ncbi:Methyltransferase type 12 [Sediminispirochaeta smaragdinae DSM 11293]|uniref:Methyltransferase type 12 n=2 Tax=Sediminispirochaeta TaxID=1911556 RepID=E1R1Z7_SEDSS|nr:Methyltransferase type 12 [Sediminispirochaeta smaragdinae DSM 11293]
MDDLQPCPLCGHSPCKIFSEDKMGRYYRCYFCSTIFLDPATLPQPEAERSRYALHQNRPTDEAYLAFLRRLADPLCRLLNAGAGGLDYGCGPVPVLAKLLEQKGMSIACYDPFFFPEQSVLEHRYDFITCCEVAEHFHRPKEEFSRMAQLLRPGGILGIMTSFFRETINFVDWYYRQDFTHVSFYTKKSMEYVADHFGFEILKAEADRNVLFLQKQ